MTQKSQKAGLGHRLISKISKISMVSVPGSKIVCTPGLLPATKSGARLAIFLPYLFIIAEREMRICLHKGVSMGKIEQFILQSKMLKILDFKTQESLDNIHNQDWVQGPGTQKTVTQKTMTNFDKM